MTLSPGARLGPYEVLSPLGAGGMGEVYKARDTRLQRIVAIKVLPPGVRAHPDRQARFAREAHAISQLTHPHICTLYDVGQDGDIDFLVMEHLEGETLAARLRRGALPLDQTLRVATEIADALDTAHRHGVVHRDLKPGNVMLTKGGAKLLDFGLAKLQSTGVAAIGATGPPTKDASLTDTGMILGTLPYMAPEQLEGKEADARTDLFAFGAVVYEMATGKKAFEGTSEASLIAAILEHDPPPIAASQPLTPPALGHVVKMCLAKDPDDRWQSASDVTRELKWIAESEAAGTAIPAGAARAGRRARSGWIAAALLAAAVILVAATIGGAWYVRSRQTTTRLTDKDTIVLSDFDNKTGDSVFDDTLKQGLAVQLEQSRFLDLISEQRVNQTLKLMGRTAGDRLTPEVTHEVCQRTGSKAMLTGSIAALGSQYVIGLKAVNCDTGEVLADAQEQAAGKEAVLKALDRGAVRVRSTLGESLSSVQQYATPVEEATTPSLETLKAYSLGVKTENAKGVTAALPFYKRAVELDPNFAMGYLRISRADFNLNEIGRSAENARKAYDLRGKVSERERFFIEGNYYFNATGELEKGAQTAELWQQTYPRDATPYVRLGFVSATLGNWEKALEEWREAVRLDPNAGRQFYLLGLAYMSFNRLEEAEAVYKQSEKRKLEYENLTLGRYWLAFLKGDAAQMAQLASAAMRKPGTEDLLLAMQADTEGWYGKLKHAHELTRRAMDSAQHNDAKEKAAGYQAEAALREVESGNREQARAEANAAVTLAPNRDVQAVAALALARAGDTAGAETLAVELDKTFPLDTRAQRYWLPTIRAAVALQRKNPNRAIELLNVPSTIELSSITADLTIFLCPVYVRGEAYLLLHDGNAAATEFQKFIDHRGVVMNFPWGALARLGLARADALQGDTVKARAAYQDFLTLWKDADADIPVLKEAKAEYAKLR